MRRLLIVLALMAASCGGAGDDVSAEAAALVDAIADQVEGGLQPGDPSLARSEAECIAESYVNTLGVAAMTELGLDEAAVRAGAGPAEAPLSDEEVEAVAAAMGRCLDMAQVMSDSLAYADLSEATLACLADAFEGDIEERLLRNTIRYGQLLPQDEPEIAFAIFDVLGRCVTPQELQRLEAGE